MANQRIYNSYDRTKLARNKYGVINNYSTLGGTSYYSDNSSAVGGTMVDLKDFRGATRTEDGVRGLVPAPLAGMNTWFLQGNGGWTRIPAYEWITEFPESAGLEKSGIQVNGDLRVTNTIKTENLEVTGAAHFFELVVDKVRAQGGQIMVSPSAFNVDYVGEYVDYNIFDANSPMRDILFGRTDIYNILKANNVEKIRCRRLYQRCDDGERRIENECAIGDMMRCRSFNIKKGTYRNISNTDYWSFICNVNLPDEVDINDENHYTDENGVTYDAIWIDLAFTLRKSDGTNYPIGTTLFLDGSTPIYPTGWNGDIQANELKKVSQETWDGTNDVIGEYWENEEWTAIQESVIKIRGLDEQVEEITGKAASNKLYDNESYATEAQKYMNEALYGNPSGQTTSGQSTNGRSRLAAASTVNMSVADQVSMILTGAPTGILQNEPDGIVETQLDRISQGVTGFEQEGKKLNLSRTVLNKFTLPAESRVDAPFIVTDPVKEYNPTTGQWDTIYDTGDVLTPATTHNIIRDVNVVPAVTTDDGTYVPADNITEYKEAEPNSNTFTPVSDDDLRQIEVTTDDTTTMMDRNTDAHLEIDYRDNTEWQFGYVSDYTHFRIKNNDELACLGHLYLTDRQNAIVLSATACMDPDLQCPAIAQYKYIDIFGKNISQFRQTAIAANGNEFIGSFLVNYNNTYMDINERINMMILDVTSGLEKVGIHLDGDSSTITLVGSVNLRQHSQDSYDTLNLYDGLNVKRLEIMPFDIPKPGEAGSHIDDNGIQFAGYSNRTTIPKSYVTRKDDWWDWKLFHTTYCYTMKNYILTTKTDANIGYLEAGYVLDMRDLQMKLKMPVYLVGSTIANDRGLGEQTVKAISFTLKRNGVEVQYDNIYNSRTKELITRYTPNGINTDTLTLYVNELFNDYVVPQAGTYTIEVTLSVQLYAYIESDNKYDNCYFTVNTNFTGSVNTQIGRTEPQRDGEGLLTAPYNGHKFTIGTNGFELVNDNSRYIYAADDGFRITWDNNYIEINEDRGIYVRRAVLEVNESVMPSSREFQLDNKHEIVYCRNQHSSYTVVLPDPTEYGLFRTITILGWIDLSAKLTVKAKGDSFIELQVLDDVGVKTIDFSIGSDYPMQALTLMSTGSSRWRIINYV